ncbi:MAG: phosphatase inhibitor-domain-containing protein [Piptocephalis tieghemiana]|nr:MAG: phosphatase inhibitor-domain-containing protein [Piptocephalis tieghemiana]
MCNSVDSGARKVAAIPIQPYSLHFVLSVSFVSLPFYVPRLCLMSSQNHSIVDASSSGVTRTLVLNEDPSSPTATLHLDPSTREGTSEVTTTDLEETEGEERHVQWEDDVVDNEFAGRKKSKVCCIFRKQREFGESSSEEDTSSDEEDEDESPHECEHHEGGERTLHRRPTPHPRKGRRQVKEEEEEEEDAKPNAYERMPKHKAPQ